MLFDLDLNGILLLTRITELGITGLFVTSGVLSFVMSDDQIAQALSATNGNRQLAAAMLMGTVKAAAGYHIYDEKETKPYLTNERGSPASLWFQKEGMVLDSSEASEQVEDILLYIEKGQFGKKVFTVPWINMPNFPALLRKLNLKGTDLNLLRNRLRQQLEAKNTEDKDDVPIDEIIIRYFGYE